VQFANSVIACSRRGAMDGGYERRSLFCTSQRSTASTCDMNAPAKEADSCPAKTARVCETQVCRTEGRPNASRSLETDDDDESGEEGALLSRGPRSQQFGLVCIWSDDGDKDNINADVLQQSKRISKIRTRSFYYCTLS
jgi:hypothetical protein